MTTYRLMDGASGRPGVGSSGTQPPSSGTSYSGSYLAGCVFEVTEGGLWLAGYQWWVANSGQDTTAQKCALWNLYGVVGSGSASLVSAGTVTSGALTAGQFNYVPLSSPVPLTPNIPYIAATGGSLSHGFPLTQHQFGSGDPYASGITSGPLHAYGYADSLGFAQQPYTTSGSDPTAVFPNLNDADDILWLDVVVTDQPPAGTLSYRAWPSMVTPYPMSGSTSTDQTGYTLGMQFSLSQACALTRIWHYSPSVATVLPSRCCIWDVTLQAEVAGTDNSSPSWSGAAGSGWVSCDYTSSGVTLQAGKQYKVSTYHGSGANWFTAMANVFGASDLQAAGIVNGPLTVPGNAASSPGQQSWNASSFAYPATTGGGGEADWVDVEVTVSAASPSGLAWAAVV
jgi:Domain of unknown function (DUF4082)